MTLTSYTGARVFDGQRFCHGALVVDGGQVVEIGAPQGQVVELCGGIIAPGFLDLQVNGSGGVQLDGQATLAGLRTICDSQTSLGATGCLPTLITDTYQATEQVIAAGIAATQAGVPGFLGLHLEGPHLDPRRKGAHDPALIRPMEERDLALLLHAARNLPTLLCTVAPEAVSANQIAALVAAGVVVSLGHSDCSATTARAAMAAGAGCATHLFNAMSQLGNREPGMVGAILGGPGFAGLIADGLHVDPLSMQVALAAKAEGVFLVTDCMGLAGTDLAEMTLGGRHILRRDGRLTLQDGTLAGADLTLSRALQVLVDQVGLGPERALAMASSVPARAIGRGDSLGHLAPGRGADFVHLSPDWALRGVWRAGQPIAPYGKARTAASNA
ncbi:N-acetylglucosamine-6-phosphate deacetylase [Fuscibacter oryzae]|uniref:N-acetylglucosamine-6-phosphate deacetylase n=1 Tax=Fuscibacter oryzae TaxID=2803939 RepID=A0A8J7MP20_9RHOB|nr:N-acetylglucosamine-6-phosphate deacetylase [Fuscibacter oryzae]MBL4927318.1 N-acetylglucosamine-6-phosphate deacetylase [Fuscibacter oryzae]